MQKNTVRLPKIVEADERYDRVVSALKRRSKLWEKASEEASLVPLSLDFIRAMQLEHKKGRMVRGFELIEKQLELQLSGIVNVEKKTGQASGHRVSRLVVISNDGSERYLRKVDRLLSLHQDRVLALIVDADSLKLGELFFGEGKAVKVLMFDHKESVASILFALVPRNSEGVK